MDFDFTEEQNMLREAVAGYLLKNYGFDARRTATATGAGWRPTVWKAFSDDLGILGASFSEAHGGLGGSAIDNMIIMEEFGKALVVEPYLSTVVIAGGLLKRSKTSRARGLIRDIIGGSAIVGFAGYEAQGRYNWADVTTTATVDNGSFVLNGRKSVVVAAPYCTHFVVTARTGGEQRDSSGISLFVVDAGCSGLAVATHSYPGEKNFPSFRIPLT